MPAPDAPDAHERLAARRARLGLRSVPTPSRVLLDAWFERHLPDVESVARSAARSAGRPDMAEDAYGAACLALAERAANDPEVLGSPALALRIAADAARDAIVRMAAPATIPETVVRRALRARRDISDGMAEADACRRHHISPDTYRHVLALRATTPDLPDDVPEPLPEPSTIPADVLARAIDRLPGIRRDIVRRAYGIQGAPRQSHADIARALGISPAAVATHLVRARKQLRHLLDRPADA